MTRAKKLLEGFKWNPNWGNLSVFSRPIIFKDFQGEIAERAYIFKWEGLDLVIYKRYDNRDSFWNYAEYYTAYPFPYDSVPNIPKEEAIKRVIEKMERNGIDKAREHISGKPKLNLTIEYI